MPQPTLHHDAASLRDKDRSLADEWLLADGIGGYASLAPLMAPTRRYHGLWVPALNPPVDRRVVLSHLEEKLTVGSREVFLSTCEYGDGFFPDGAAWAERFDLDPLPRLVSRVDDLAVDREVLLLRDGAGVCLTYRVAGEGPWKLDLGPLLAMRPFHYLYRRRENFRVEGLAAAPGWRACTDGMPAVFLWTDGPATVTVEPTWYFGVHLRVERQRGFDCQEDVLLPGRWSFSGEGPAEWRLFASFDPPHPIDAARESKRVVSRRRDLLKAAGLAPASRRKNGSPNDERIQRLVLAADAFLVRRRVDRETLATVIAGYHWFGDWGRDAMIALPGLAMETGRIAEAEKVLRAFAGARSEGMIPNVFSEETGRPEYNTVDASLWFLQTIDAYLRFGSHEFVRECLWPAALEICGRYQSGTRFDIHADTDGLITGGSPQTQLTWMDAQCRGRPVTPRYGKAVEINALWISGLGLMADLAETLDLAPPPAAADLERRRQAFVDLFWNEAAACLYDGVFPDGLRDASIRPNQILAVGLPHGPLEGDAARAKSVVGVVRERLLTPRGLRTLAPGHAAYRGRYEGGPDERDSAYHQGTAWPWLVGPYVDALFAVEDPRTARQEAARILDGLLDSMETGCLGQINEIFDGDPPQRPVGAAAQAWSVAAAIHVWRKLEAKGGAE